MRANPPVVAIAALLALAACGQTTRWEKPQATAETTAADRQDCRQQAEREAWRDYGLGAWRYGYPFYATYPGYGPLSWHLESRMRQDRYFAEQRLAAFCMQNKGYERVVVEEQPKA